MGRVGGVRCLGNSLKKRGFLWKLSLLCSKNIQRLNSPQTADRSRADGGNTVTLSDALITTRAGTTEPSRPNWGTAKGTWGCAATSRALDADRPAGVELVAGRASAGVAAYRVGAR